MLSDMINGGKIMKNRFLCLLIAITVCLSQSVAFATDASYNRDSAITLVKTLDIMVGDASGNMMLDSNVTRAEFTKIAVVMSSYRNSVPAVSTTSVFSDCTFKHWAAPYVKIAVVNGIVNGYPNGTFKPDNTVTLEEACTVMLKLLGYTNDDFGNSWPYGQIGIAKNIHLLDNMDCNIGDTLKRGDVVTLIYNTLVANPKNAQNTSSKYLEQLECNLYEDAVIIATNKQNNSVAPGYVLTSAGTFKLNGELNSDYIGRKGDLVVENKNDFAGFMPSDQNVKKYVVYSKLDNTMVAYSNNGMTNFDVDDNVTAYLNTNKTTFSQVKNTIQTGDTIYLMSDIAGNVEYITVSTGSMKGPYTVKQSDVTRLLSQGSGLSLMRNGVKCTAADVTVNDIVYYLPETNTVFAYSKKVTGVYEKATPNRDMPNSVTVSGKEYSIETVTAFDKLSSNGNFKLGDTVTLLLGKDGKIADVQTSGKSADFAGYLKATGTKKFTNSDGDTYSSVYATLVCTDGSEVEVITRSDYSSYINKIMNVSYKNGVASLAVIKEDGNVSGVADSGNMTIGKSKVADNVNILDVSTDEIGEEPGTYTVTFMQRLDGINIESKQVLYAKKDSSGKITDIILNNVTGDCYKYGVITDIAESGSNTGMSVTSKRYTCDILGEKYTCNINYGSTFSKNMPAAFNVSGSGIVQMKKLNQISGSVQSIGDGIVVVDGEEYLLSDKVAVYKVSFIGSTSAFTILPINELKNDIDNYNISVYNDKSQTKGGRVRVIVARE